MKPFQSRILRGTSNHFSWFLPQQQGRISTFLLKFLFSGVRFGKEQADVMAQLPPDAITVYVPKHKSQLERLFFYDRHQTGGMPCPEVGIGYRSFLFQPLGHLFRIALAHTLHFFRNWRPLNPFTEGYVQQALEQGRTGIVPLVQVGRFGRSGRTRTDPLQFLLDVQRNLERPIFLVPYLFFYGTHTQTAAALEAGRSTGVDPKPGLGYRLALLMATPERVFVEISEPTDLRDYIQQGQNARLGSEALALNLRHRLIDQITRHRQSITGPILKPIEEIRQQILTTTRLRSFMGSWAQRRSLTMFQVQQEAVRYVDEIAARPSPLLLRMAAMMVRWLVNNVFEGLSVNVEGINRMKRAGRQGPLIIMPCHKSNMDSLIVSYLMSQHGMPCPHVFAGKNLAFWPMGPIFRRFGAFFVRRSFKGAVFYAKVFSEYIHMLLDQGFNMTVFVEGTRSRNGKLLLPKLGMLAILLNAVKNGACQTLHFIPVFIGYDRVPELGSYIHEAEGGQKEPESFLAMLKARKLLKNRFGKIYVRFCDPISLDDLAVDHGGPVRRLPPRNLNNLCREVGGRVMAAVDGNAVVTPQSLVSAAILNSPGAVIPRSRLVETFEAYLAYLAGCKAAVSDTLLVSPGQALDSILYYYERAKYIHPVHSDRPQASDRGRPSRYRVNPARRPVLEYYKNNCIAFFVPAAFTAMSIIRYDAFLFTVSDLRKTYVFLSDLFQNEFNRRPNETPGTQIQRVVDQFTDAALLFPSADLAGVYHLTSQGYRTVKSYAAFLKPLFESYRIVLTAIARPDKRGPIGPDLLKAVQNTGQRMYKRGEIDGKEALSKFYYENALACFSKNGVRGAKATEKIHHFQSAIEGCLKALADG